MNRDEAYALLSRAKVVWPTMDHLVKRDGISGEWRVYRRWVASRNGRKYVTSVHISEIERAEATAAREQSR